MLLHPRRVVRDELPVLLVLLAADVRVHAARKLQPHQLAPGQVASRGAWPAEKSTKMTISAILQPVDLWYNIGCNN